MKELNYTNWGFKKKKKSIAMWHVELLLPPSSCLQSAVYTTAIHQVCYHLTIFN